MSETLVLVDPRRRLWMLDGGPGVTGTTTYGRHLELLAEHDPELEIACRRTTAPADARC